MSCSKCALAIVVTGIVLGAAASPGQAGGEAAVAPASAAVVTAPAVVPADRASNRPSGSRAAGDDSAASDVVPPAAAAPQAKPRAERPVPFAPGEVLGYDVSWSTYLTAGTLTVAVNEKRPSFGSVAYYITAEGRPTPLLSKLYALYYKADTLLDAYTLLPQRGSTYSEENGRRRMKITRFNQAARTVEFEMQTSTVFKKSVAVPPYAQDILSALFVIRALPLKTGAKITMPVSDSGDLYRVTIAVGGRELVRTGIGNVNALKLIPTIVDPDGQPAGRGVAIWVTDDGRRLPVKLQGELAVGSFVLVLRDAKGVR
jgi:hypothetical protein